MSRLISDRDWVRQSFLLADRNNKLNLDVVDLQNRIFSDAALKYTDTTPGGNFAMNPVPQFTRSADIKVKSLTNAGSKGMGRFYSEKFDDRQQLIHIRAGVSTHNSLTTFFTGFYDTGAGQLARTGRSTGVLYQIGKLAGMLVPLLSWKLLAVHLIGTAARFFFAAPSSKYYYLKPAMPLYWNAVTTMANRLAVNRGLVPRVFSSANKLGESYEFSPAELDNFSKMMPDVFMFSSGGNIDIYKLCTRAQRLARRHHAQLAEKLTRGKVEDMGNQLHKILSAPISDSGGSFENYMNKWLSSEQANPNEAGQMENGTEVLKKTPSKPNETVSNDRFFQFLAAEEDDGSQFVTFRVNYTGQMNESFSNTVGESELSNKFNSMSGSARSTRFSFADGNLDDSAVGKIIGGIAGGVKNLVTGIADGLSISGLAAFAGSAFVDIPKHWQQSVANLTRMNYTINLTSPYGNPLSQFMNLDLPLVMLLALALPLSTGKQSYTSPFLLELYDKGRAQTRLGMIDSISITRGTGNLGFNSDGHAMALEIAFSVVDMSSVMHMPISEGFSLGGAIATGMTLGLNGASGQTGASITNGIFDSDTAFSDYMAVLSGMGMYDQIYTWQKFKMNLTYYQQNWKSWTSEAHFAQFIGDTLPARIISGLYRGTSR